MAHEQNTAETGMTAGDVSAVVHQPDTLAVAQYISDRVQSSLCPEKRLMLAILEDAIVCFQQYHAARQGKRKQKFDSVRQWFFEAGGDWVFSFENICSALAMDPRYIRSGLLRWLKRRSSTALARVVWRENGKSSLARV